MFYIQHGYGKSQKIDAVSRQGKVHGVILSPGHEDAPTLEATAASCRAAGLDVLVDPQSYIYSTKPRGALRFHARNGIEFSNMHWSASAVSVLAQVSSVEGLGVRLGVRDRVISPSPFHASFGDYWMPAGLQYARTASSEWSGNRVLASVAISQEALSDWATVQDWLDAVTLLDVRGFYLIVSRSGSMYPAIPWDPRILANLLRVIHTLSVINGFEVIWGYADVDGILGLAAGAKGVAAGWSYSLRQFSIDRYYQERSGGAQPIPRLLVPELLSDLRTTEIADVIDIAGGAGIGSIAGWAASSVADTSNPDAQVRHLITLSQLVDEVAGVPLRDRLSYVRDLLVRALENLERLSISRVAVEPRHATRVRSYLDAIDLFGRETAR